MIIKEKVIFWSFLTLFIAITGVGFFSQGNKKGAAKELLRDLRQATRKTIAKKKAERDKWDTDKIEAADTLKAYKPLLKRSLFFRVHSKTKVKEVEAIPLKKAPKKPKFNYKGRVIMGAKVMVIIEDQGTGKSFFVREGDMVGGFEVVDIGEKEVTLKQKDGKEIVLRSMKKKMQDKKDEEKAEGTE